MRRRVRPAIDLCCALAVASVAGCDCGVLSHSLDGGTDASADAGRASEDAGPDADASEWPPPDPDPVRCLSWPELGMNCPADRPFCCVWVADDGVVTDGVCVAERHEERRVVLNDTLWTYCAELPDDCGQSDAPDCPLVDADGDGYASARCGGQDCADDDPSVHPGVDDLVEPDPWMREPVIEPPALLGWQSQVARLGLESAGEPVTVVQDPSLQDVPRVGVYRRDVDGWSVEALLDAPGSLAGLVARPGAATMLFFAEDPVVVQPRAPRVLSARAPDWVGTEVVSLAGVTAPVRLAPAIDAEGHGAVLLYRGMGLELAFESAEGWVSETVLPEHVAGANLALALEPDGAAHVAVVSGGDLFHMTNRSGAWESELVDCSLGIAEPSIALDASGAVHIAYQRWSRGGVWYATNASGAFERERVATGLGAVPTRVAVGPDDSVHLLYRVEVDGSPTYGQNAFLEARREAGGWSSRLLEHDSHLGDLAAGGANDVHVTYAPRGRSIWRSDPSLFYARLTNPARVDQDCDGVDGTDADGDTWASIASGGQDCDDTDPTVLPGKRSDRPDGVDDNCTGIDGDDADEDGYLSADLGGDDCDDADPAFAPGAPDREGDGLDTDCDGQDG